HTRSDRDWSSDVCPSDLRGRGGERGERGERPPRRETADQSIASETPAVITPEVRPVEALAPAVALPGSDETAHGSYPAIAGADKIGRASCRDREEVEDN